MKTIQKLQISTIFLRNTIFAVMFFLFAGNAFALTDVEEGSIITFGRYPQTASNEIKPIEWRVLEIKDNKALLIADKGLDVVHNTNNTESENVTWKTSSIRQWLNTVFYNTAFNEYEKSRIAITIQKNPDNLESSTESEDETRDLIFLLSIDDAERYFMDDTETVQKVTPYAVKRGAYLRENLPSATFWWIKSPGLYQYYTSFVNAIGTRRLGGKRVYYVFFAIRPALWINLQSKTEVKKPSDRNQTTESLLIKLLRRR